MAHPFWVFQWELLWHPEVAASCVALFLAAVLCSASGIGGGGIYVAVLMVLGRVSTHNAVPLSKAIVFFGAVASTLLNLRRQLAEGGDDRHKTNIDFDACRVVVPMALFGTYMGVVLNFHVPEKVIVVTLAVILCGMTVMVVQTAWKQHKEEEDNAKGWGPLDADVEAETEPLMRRGLVGRPSSAPLPSAPNTTAAAAAGESGGHYAAASSAGGKAAATTTTSAVSTPPAAPAPTTVGERGGESEDIPAEKGKDYCSSSSKASSHRSCGSGAFVSLPSILKPGGNSFSKADVISALLLVCLVVFCGVLRFHVHACRAEQTGHGVPGSCRHPIMNTIFGGHFEAWVSNHFLSVFLPFLVIAAPVGCCLAMSIYYGRTARSSGWRRSKILAYQFTAMCTGLLAGLVGIGGGLIFSPFFLLMGMEPHVAVGTSSTCVLFTSSSTTIQYLFTDRILMSLALVYGVVTLLGSSGGTTLVHALQDTFSTKKSYITWVVAAGVATSAVLSLAKFVELAH
eukprot:CAMPEP_0206426578 /NCGR_PEP_ID=MMETSP0324_2-20121206/4446_1 /ASSEMBLY_ACC=CAM_ASM_000836 /TAXON_ID=2866 /ORGANISM="Crypthecodinium cohnii, Strain Seligo" /LENGTH=511 /DNA_ID=CAMNT_0053891529 /DNA_START=157 /DNA_END=1692 /DNA_ORIENTATION=+